MKNTRRRSLKSQNAKKCRDREVRDLYIKLRKKFTYKAILDFFQVNYFIQEHTLMTIVKRVDKEPVKSEDASITYKAAIKDTFNL